MIYWEEMTSKYGFNDGESVPPFVEKYRAAYVMAINKVAEAHESNVRVVAYDRPGCHNWCIIIRISKKDYDKINNSRIITNGEIKLSDYDIAGFVESDGKFDEALEAVKDIDIDSYFDVKIEFDRQGLEEELSQFMPSIDMKEFEECL